jgi:hypothetical protein
MTSLALSKTGRPLEEQLVHADRAARLEPSSATFLERRADLLFGLGRLRKRERTTTVRWRWRIVRICASNGPMSVRMDDLDSR